MSRNISVMPNTSPQINTVIFEIVNIFYILTDRIGFFLSCHVGQDPTSDSDYLSIISFKDYYSI